MSRPGFAALAICAVASVSGCGSGARDPSRLPRGGDAVCGALHPLTDLQASLSSPATFGGSSDAFFLVDVDDTLGYLRVAHRRLAAIDSPRSRTLDQQVTRFDSSLQVHRDELDAAFRRLQQTHLAAELALGPAGLCRGIRLRDSEGETSGTKDASTVTAKERRQVLGSRACAPAIQLWSAVRDADLTSELSTSSIAAHIRELSLDSERGAVRNRVAQALRSHAEALADLRRIAAPTPDQQDGGRRALIRQSTDLVASLESTNRTCVASLDVSARVVGSRPVPRRVTVTVRPKWTGALAALPHPEEFGSGFIIRWRNRAGAVEARIVTNAHVMDGAFHAEIVPGDPELEPGAQSTSAPGAKGWPATLVGGDPHEDVAILRFDSADAAASAAGRRAESRFTEGLALRLVPAKEQEQVIAAGFPGVGVAPSFQVSKGSVSNARFGADGRNDDINGAYVQHTAPIDPGNSGGPLLDAEGRLLGMNTFKIAGRENVGLAIPTIRIQQALLRAEEPVVFDDKHAEASCNAAVAALAAPNPAGAAMSRFGLALYAWTEANSEGGSAATYRERVRGQASNPVEIARLRAYGAVRERLEREGGVRPYALCDVRQSGGVGEYVATFRSRSGEHRLRLAEEHGVLRVTAFE